MYYKIINKEWNHNRYQYVPGLNILKEKFNDDPNNICGPGGFYFTTAEHIFKFLNYGCYLVEVDLPTSDPDFKMVADSDGDKFRSNKIILGKTYELSDAPTFSMLIEKGVNIHVDNDFALNKYCYRNNYEMVKLLIDNGANIYVNNCYLLIDCAGKGYIDIVKLLIQSGMDNKPTEL